MGHALVAASLPGVDPVLKVSIIPRGAGALGYTIQHPTEDHFVLAASELRHRIAVLMGGRAAEVLLFEGDISTGAADDLQRATEIATEMVTLYGMVETFGQRTYKPARQALDKPVASEATLREIDLSPGYRRKCLRQSARHSDAAARRSRQGSRAFADKGSDHRRGFSGYPAGGNGQGRLSCQRSRPDFARPRGFWRRSYNIGPDQALRYSPQ
jgi:hypothetical protein